MFDIAKLIRDRYNREARLVPALLVLLPCLVTAFIWLPELRSIGSVLLALLTSCGIAVPLTHFARDRGSRLQDGLYRRWGGQPSTAALRRRDGTLSTELKQRYYRQISKIAPEVILPSEKEELDDPTAADHKYRAACEWLIANTKDKKRFDHLFDENVSYGFRRNIWALKPLMLVLCGAMLAAVICYHVYAFHQYGQIPEALQIAGLILLALYACALLALVNAEWVHLAAKAYARQLLQACDMLQAAKSATKQREHSRAP